MNWKSKIFIAGVLALPFAIPAIADVNYTQGSGTVIFDFTCFTTKHCSAHVPVNSAGTEIFTSGAPGQVTGANGTFPATQSGTWTVQPGNTANTTPWLSSISNVGGTTQAQVVANSDALANQAGISTNAQTQVYNGTTWDRLRGDTTNGAFVNVKTSVLPTGASTSANQTSQITQETATATGIGAPADSSWVSGSGSVIAILKNIATGVAGAVAAGANYIGQIGVDPSNGGATPGFAFLALPATTTTQIVALSGSTKTYVTSLLAEAGGTVNFTFKYGTGSNCGTGTTTLSGPWPLTAQAGFTQGAGLGAVMIVPAGQALCVTTDASVTGGVHLTYQQK